MEKYKPVTNESNGRRAMLPANCNHPLTENFYSCYARHPLHEECDCRWCCFNKEYCKANQMD